MYLRALFCLIAAAAAFRVMERSDPQILATADERLMAGMLVAVALLLIAPMLAPRRVNWKYATASAFSWVAAFVTLTVAEAHRTELTTLWRAVNSPPATLAVARGTNEVAFTKTWDGHFRAPAKVNGVDVALLVDTGASVVLLRYEDAAAVGVDVDTLDFSSPVTTANGRGTVAAITLESLRIGDVELRDVRAAVAEPGKLQTGLLGMSFLGALSEVSFRGDMITLRR